MATRMLKRYGLEGAAKILIAIGLLLVLFAWVAGVHYFGIIGKVTLFVVPLIFTCVLALLLLVIRYRYTLFEKYPYLMNLPSLFYRIKEQKGKGTNNQSIAFSLIFTVHSLVVAFLGILSVVLTISIGSSIRSGVASPLLYIYLVLIAILGVSVLFQYRRIYVRFVK
ncbi:MAG: hypothetical protein KGH61_00160 [Candidatus Micrarchaeota archaeon]|nr:hypothetical protein [Candidatus Micrarchaeota archaeon]MDE1847350.1 hypothetical protein [Candidatus Micrarchaeota archaeon]MDE1863965.1 hypothetical protein [Candidatus Micrarchaeota archaeon]